MDNASVKLKGSATTIRAAVTMKAKKIDLNMALIPHVTTRVWSGLSGNTQSQESTAPHTLDASDAP
jgi:hypothetical protein